MCLWRSQSARLAENQKVSVRFRAGTPYAAVAQRQEQAGSNGQGAGWIPAGGARMEDRLRGGREPLDLAVLVRVQLLQPHVVSEAE
jgi:hypothetical protein